MTRHDHQPDPVVELYEHAPCGLLSTSADGVVELVNETFLDWIGIDRSLVVGHSFTELLEPGSQLFYETRHLPILRLQGELREVAVDIHRADGSTLPALINSIVIEHSDDRPPSVRIAVFDSTVRRDYERELLTSRRAAEAAADRVRVLQSAASAFADTSSAEQLAQALVASAKEAMTASAATVVLVDSQGATYVAAGEHPLAELAARNPAELASFRRAEVSVIPSVDDVRPTHPLLADAMVDARVASISIVPIVGPVSPVGALMLFFAREREFDAHDVDLQVALARQAAQVLSRMQLQRELEALALHDQLTGLVNRTVIQESLRRALDSAIGEKHPMALIVVDLDGFKPVNDRLGHAVGDSMLRWVAARLSAVVRTGDVVGRFGGDEFAIICENVDRDRVGAIAERIVSALREQPDIGQGAFAISASVGVALHDPRLPPEPMTSNSQSPEPLTPESIFVAADAAMYRSKAEGRNRSTVVQV